MQKCIRTTLAVIGFLLISCSSYSRDIDQILDRWKNPSATDIFIVAHRAAFMEGGQLILPENAIPSIEYAISLGVDMVELDIRATKDNHFVLIHDATIDRTTNGSGSVADFSLAELREFWLINEVTGENTIHKIPTLEEVYEAVKDRIMVNLDPKLPVRDLGQALAMAEEVGVADQVMLKGTADTAEQLGEITNMLAQLPFEAEFMPMHWDKNTNSLSVIEKSFATLKPEAAEMVVDIARDSEVGLRDDGGFLFSPEVRDLAKRNGVHLWINTLYVDPRGHPLSDSSWLNWNGGRHDILGLKYPEKVFKFWVNQGATIMQTDEPKFLIEYLESQGLRN